VAGVGAEEPPARGIDGGWRRLPRRLRGKRRGRRCLDNKRTGEVLQGPGELGKWSAGGERERVHELKAAAAMARWSLGWRAEGGGRRLNSFGLGSWVTAA
jgi:hypothetical protein